MCAEGGDERRCNKQGIVLANAVPPLLLDLNWIRPAVIQSCFYVGLGGADDTKALPQKRVGVVPVTALAWSQHLGFETERIQEIFNSFC